MYHSIMYSMNQHINTTIKLWDERFTMNEIDIYSQPSYDSTTKLYHITSNYNEDRLLKFKIRDKPTDTPLLIHEVVNKLSVKKFKLPIRSLFFTYTKKMSNNAMRVIPLGNNVQYFYHPDIEDFTSWFYFDAMPMVDEAILDYVERYDLEADISQLETALTDAIAGDHGLKATHDMLITNYSELLGAEHGTNLTKNVLAKMVGILTDYINDVVYTTDISDIPENTDSEVMVYAPNDLYLLKSKQ